MLGGGAMEGEYFRSKIAKSLSVVREKFGGSEGERVLELLGELFFLILSEEGFPEKRVQFILDAVVKLCLEGNISLFSLLSAVDRVAEELALPAELRGAVSLAKEVAAKLYLFTELSRDGIFSDGTTLPPRFCEALKGWIEEFNRLLLQKRFQEAVLFASLECPFRAMMGGLSYRMYCFNQELCRSVVEAHDLMHERAQLLARMLSLTRFLDAYVAYKDLRDSVGRFVLSLQRLVLVFASSQEEIFFRFAEDAISSCKGLVLYMVSVNGGLPEASHQRLASEVKRRLEDMGSVRADVAVAKGCGPEVLLLAPEDPDLFLYQVEALLRDMDNNGSFTLVAVPLDGLGDVHWSSLRRLVHRLRDEAVSLGIKRLVADLGLRNRLLEEVEQRYRDERFLKRALSESRVEVFFQPIFKGENGSYTVFALEALARMEAEDRFVPASLFISLIHRLGLEKRLDVLVLNRVAEYAPYLKRLCRKVSVNISPSSLKSEEVVSALLHLSRVFEGEGMTLVVELTEHTVMDSLELLKKLYSEYGVTFAVDDFGSGYSSLKAVADLVGVGALEMLKIDGSVVKGSVLHKGLERVLRLVAGVARELDVPTVAEFVEDEKVLLRLSEFGISHFQGFLLGKPRHIAELVSNELH